MAYFRNIIDVNVVSLKSNFQFFCNEPSPNLICVIYISNMTLEVQGLIQSLIQHLIVPLLKIDIRLSKRIAFICFLN